MLDKNITDNEDSNDDNTTRRDSFFCDKESFHLQMFRGYRSRKPAGVPGTGQWMMRYSLSIEEREVHVDIRERERDLMNLLIRALWHTSVMCS